MIALRGARRPYLPHPIRHFDRLDKVVLPANLHPPMLPDVDTPGDVVVLRVTHGSGSERRSVLCGVLEHAAGGDLVVIPTLLTRAHGYNRGP